MLHFLRNPNPNGTNRLERLSIRSENHNQNSRMRAREEEREDTVTCNNEHEDNEAAALLDFTVTKKFKPGT